MEKITVVRNGKEEVVEVDKAELTNDGYHTFKELYRQRLILSALAFKLAKNKGWKVWRSLKHHNEDTPCFGGGWFHVGVTRPDGLTYSYHYEMKDFNLFDFAEDVEHSPEWDGHTAADIDRLLPLLQD